LSNITSPTTSFFWQATQRNYFNMTKKSGNLGRSSGFFNLMEKFKFSHWNSKTPTIDLKSSNSGSASMSALTSNHNLSSENIADPKDTGPVAAFWPQRSKFNRLYDINFSCGNPFPRTPSISWWLTLSIP
jgi:hypothetical protein